MLKIERKNMDAQCCIYDDLLTGFLHGKYGTKDLSVSAYCIGNVDEDGESWMELVIDIYHKEKCVGFITMTSQYASVLDFDYLYSTCTDPYTMTENVHCKESIEENIINYLELSDADKLESGSAISMKSCNVMLPIGDIATSYEVLFKSKLDGMVYKACYCIERRNGYEMFCIAKESPAFDGEKYKIVREYNCLEASREDVYHLYIQMAYNMGNK